MVARLVLIGLLVVLSAAILRYVLLSTWLREDLEALVSAERLAIAHFVANDVEAKLQQRRVLLERMAQSLPPELLDQPGPLREWLRVRHELVPLFALGFRVIGADGGVIADHPPAAQRTASTQDNGAIGEALAGRPAIGGPFADAVSKQAALPMSMPVRDGSGTVRGALVGLVPVSAFDFHDIPRQNTHEGAGGLLLISPRDKLFVSSTDPSMILRPTPAEGINRLHDRAMQGYRGTGITVNAKGVEEFSAMVSVPTTGWFVVARIPTADAFAAVARTRTILLRGTVLSVVLVLLLVAGLCWWEFRPLFEAARDADAMTRGDAPLQPLRVRRDDEVGHLTAAFNRLLLKLDGSQRELARMAHHDSLTGLPNRRLLADRLQQALARARRNRTCLALLVMDLDGFKPINDAHGHEGGDRALRTIARRFADALRQNDTLARVGGDEFVLLATDLGGADEAARAAQAIAAKCIAIASQPLGIEAVDTRLGVSIGIAVCDGCGNVDELLNVADQAMYEAKQAGGGRYVLAGRVAGSADAALDCARFQRSAHFDSGANAATRSTPSGVSA